jgi:serine/threonine protein kinase
VAACSRAQHAFELLEFLALAHCDQHVARLEPDLSLRIELHGAALVGRQVAIKVLPDAFAQDPDRLARFEREAKTLASLNHPNIAIIHGLKKTDGIRALVMELVEGPTLADRIERGPIPIDEALPIAKQIAEAFEAAHGHRLPATHRVVATVRLGGLHHHYPLEPIAA